MSQATEVESSPAATYQPSAKDFDLLRKMEAGLDKQIATFNLTRFALVVIVTFLFASALHRRNDAVIQTTLVQINLAASKDREKTSILDPISMYLFAPYQGEEDQHLQDLVGTLKNQYGQAFTVKFSILGTDLTFDLRLIIVTFPLWLSLAQIYLSILREKRRLIRFTAFTFAANAPPGETTAVDRILYQNKETPYASYPSVLIDVSFWIVVGILLAMMISIIDLRAGEAEGEPATVNFGLVIVLIFAFYGSAFSSLISNRLRKQVQSQLDREVPLDTFGRMWSLTNQWLFSLPSRMKPRLPLLAGGLLTLSTLILQTAQVRCSAHAKPRQESRAAPQKTPTGHAEETDPTGEGRPGYQILTGSAEWPPSLFPFTYAVNEREAFYGRIVYGLSLFLALLTLGLVGFISSRRLRLRTLIVALSRTYALISIAFICEFANPTLLLWDWVWLGPLLITIVLFLFIIFGNQRWEKRAPKIYRALRMAYVSLIVADLVYLISVALRLPGLLVLFVSVHLMTLGYFSARNLLTQLPANGPAITAEAA